MNLTFRDSCILVRSADRERIFFLGDELELEDCVMAEPSWDSGAEVKALRE
jgi:hypothetical protein